MIRFVDVVPAAEPRKAAAPTPPKSAPAAGFAAPLDAADTPKPAKAPRKPKTPA